ncbi:MarR family winged helix-turn-helix transcriptional regulator [Nonomuraea sp. NPDC050783]|uniref:MarR family winged helix-turn-helix transcriptional regulator n=1 Tax=Nonomuraea sp. NPDC050783 TaxID=3154634 RepID=UPI003467D745
MDEADRPAFERGAGFLLARLGSLAARSWAAFLHEHGLTQAQYLVLTTVRESGPLGQRRLAELIAVDARNLVTVLDSLAARGLVRRRAHEGDRRRRIVTLTDAGTALLDAVAAAAAVEQDRFLRALTRRDRTHLNRLLRALYDAHTPAGDQASG